MPETDPDAEVQAIRAAALEYRRLPVIEALERIERDERVAVLQAVCDDRRLRVRDAANRRLWILSTRGPGVLELAEEPAKPKRVRPRR